MAASSRLRGPRRAAWTAALFAAPLIALAAAVSLGVVAAAKAAPGDYHFVQKWGSFGPGPQQFDRPNALVLTGSSLFVVEQLNHRASRYSTSGALQNQWGTLGSGNGQFSSPMGAAFSGFLFVADTGNHRIQRFSSVGVYLSQFGSHGSASGQFTDPTGIAVGPTGTLYVVDRGNSRIQRFDINGNYLGQWGGAGSVDGEFSFPWGVAVNQTNGNVYVVDAANQRVQYFTATGTFLGKWGSFGTGALNFMNPRGIAIDASGNVYVADQDNNRIKKFSPTGTLLKQIGTSAGPSSADGQFDDPYGVAVTPDGATVFTSEEDNHRIQKFVLDLTPPVTSISGLPAQEWSKTDVAITLNATDDLAGVDAILYRLNGGPTSAYTGPLVFSSEGVTTLEYRATDKDANAEALKTAIIRIDKTGPTAKALRNVTARRNAKAIFRYRVDDLAPQARVALRIYQGTALKKTLNVGQKVTNVNRSFVWPKAKLPKGTYKWKVFATDLAGNAQQQIGQKTLTIL